MSKSLDIVYGKSGDYGLELQLVDRLKKVLSEGTLYIGYPIFAFGEGKLRIAVLYSSREFGLTVFDFDHYGQPIEKVEREITKHQEYIFSALVAKMFERPEMRSGRSLALHPQIVSLHYETSRMFDDGTLVSTFDDVIERLTPAENLSDELYQHLNAFIQRSSALRPPKNREHVKSTNSIGYILQKIEKEIVNLDHSQNKAAIESCEKPQRIRGLAGSGKTIVLALKAALTHIANPSWRILITFHSRSLFQQFEILVKRFTYEYQKEEPNWDKVTIMHAWGNRESNGVYSEICRQAGQRSIGYTESTNKYGRINAFNAVCRELIDNQKTRKIPEVYDAVFMDEAQDLPPAFFELVYSATLPPKRIVYAYDELQSLNELKMKPPEQLFGLNEDGVPRVVLKNKDNAPMEDLTLDVCYRNPPWILSAAHALGFGIYSEDGIVQIFDDPQNWIDLGYEKISGKLEYGAKVTLKRSQKSSPSYFKELINIDNSMIFKTFPSREKEHLWLRDQVLENLREDEVDPDDILIIIANTLDFKSEYYEISKLLGIYNFGLHAPGIVSSHELFFKENSIAISNVHRAKGNEAPIVYLVGAEYCMSKGYPHTKRNILFTALTRARGWVRITGAGQGMNSLEKEFNRIKKNNFSLSFTYPTEKDLKQIRTLSDDENKSLRRQKEYLQKAFDNEISLAEIPIDVKRDIMRFIE